MKWKSAVGLANKRKNASNKSKSVSAPSSPKRRAGGGGSQGPIGPPAPTTPTLGTIRLGTLRAGNAPICTPTPRAKRQLISDLLEPNGGGDGSAEDDGVGASPAIRGIISKKSSSGMNFDKEVGRGESFSSYTTEEKVAFASHLNQHLLGDAFLKHLLPLDARGSDLFSKFHDGVLMCRLVCLAIPGSIADAKINLPAGDEPLGLYKSTENLNAALTAAEAAGLQVVNIGAADIIDGRPASILGLSWQLIRVHLLAQINLKGCPDLIHLMEEGEDKEAFFKLPVEELLLRWFNHHLRWAGSARRISNFTDDLADGRCYVTLIKELNDSFKGEESDFPDEDEKRAHFRRACLVISGAEGIGLAPLIRPRHINGKFNLYNIAFVAQLLNSRPRIHRESLHLQASVDMQAWYRMVRVMHATAPIIAERRASATTLSRACRRWLSLRERQRAATALQAWRRGGAGRAKAAKRRFEVARAEAAQSAAKAAAAEAAARAAAAEAEAKAAAFESAERAAAAATALKMAAIKREKETAAAVGLQAWARGMEARRAVSAAMEARKLPPLITERSQEGDSSGSNPKHSQTGASITPRTSVSSSIRYSVSEDSPSADSAGFSFGGVTGTDSGKSRGNGTDNDHRNEAGQEEPKGWFDKVFAGMSFGGTGRNNNPKKGEAAAAIVLQRWRRRVAERKLEACRAAEQVAYRRWAVRTLHKAYADKWRFEVKARKDRRHKWEKEEKERRQEEESKAKLGWFSGLFGEILSRASKKSGGLGGDDTEEESLSAKERRQRRQALEKKAEDEGGCCDAAGHGVIASEIVAWKPSYVSGLVVGSSGHGKAQEARARHLAKVGADDHAWRSPEDVLSAGRFVAMVSVLLSVLYESAIYNAATVGV